MRLDFILYRVYLLIARRLGFRTHAQPALATNFNVAGLDGDSLSLASSNSHKSTSITGKEEIISMERIQVRKGQQVWIDGMPYAIVSTQGDIVIDAIDVEAGGGNYSAMSPEDFFGMYTYVDASGWVVKPKYKVGKLKNGLTVRGHALCDTKDSPSWVYVVQHGDEKPLLLSEEQMKAETKEDIGNTWVRWNKRVVWVQKVNTQSLSARVYHGPDAPTVSIPLEDKLEIIPQPKLELGDTIDGHTIKSISHTEHGWLYTLSNFSGVLEKI